MQDCELGIKMKAAHLFQFTPHAGMHVQGFLMQNLEL